MPITKTHRKQKSLLQNNLTEHTTELYFSLTSGEDSLIVTLEVFSGVPDPQWTIQENHPNYTKIKNSLNSATKYSPENAPSKLGYEGFLVQEVINGNNQSEVLIVGPETEQLQLDLLYSIPDDKISSFINSILEREIKSGNVSANVTNTDTSNTAKRYAPSYRPSYWNGPAHVRLNNCYNYASAIRNDTFAQPGNGGGRPLPWVFTAADVRRSAEADGCIFKPARKHMCAPRGTRHLAALFVYIGKYIQSTTFPRY